MNIKGSLNRCGGWLGGLLSPFLSYGLAVVLVLLPSSAVAFGQGNSIIGSVSAAGTVQLRGVALSSEGTLFDGDSIRTAGESYVRVRLTDGHQLELGTDTDVQVDRGDSGVQIEMSRGIMAFSSPQASLPLTVNVESLTIEAPQGAAAEVAFLAPNRLSVTALTESLTVIGAPGQQGEPVAEGEQVIIDLDAAVEGTEAPPQESDAQDESAGGSATKVVVISASAGAAAGVGIILATRCDDSASGSTPC